jgi:pimeloyl-ACP methyl ester carboxylesterase
MPVCHPAHSLTLAGLKRPVATSLLGTSHERADRAGPGLRTPLCNRARVNERPRLLQFVLSGTVELGDRGACSGGQTIGGSPHYGRGRVDSKRMPSVAVNGTDLWYSDEGAGDGVLVIHGAGSDGRMWAEDLVPLARTHRVIALNRRGYLGSGPAVTDWRVHGDDAAQLVDSLDVAPLAVVAHSAGSIVALDLAVRRPELVSSLVLLDPAYGTQRNITPKLAAIFLKVQLLRRLGRKRQAIDTWLRFATSYQTGGSAFEHMPEERRELLRGNASGVFADLASRDGSHIHKEDLASIRVPATIITADLSPSFLQKTSASLAKRLTAVSTRTLQRAGHAMAFDQSEALLAELRRALDGASATAPSEAATQRL